MPIRSIDILFHEKHRNAEQCHYRVWSLAHLWRERGIRVQPLYGISKRSTADLLFPHVDISYIPDDYWAFIQSHPRVVNRAVRDIRKTRISTHRITPGDGYTGPAIVKTVANCYGMGDQNLAGHTLLSRLRRRLARSPRLERAMLGSVPSLHRYHIFESVAQVPRAAFRNHHLHVERFLPNQSGEEFTLYLFTVLGPRTINRTLISRDPFVKSDHSRVGEPLPSPPPEILARRAELGLDYGKMDYTIHRGVPVLLDVNTTPVMSDPPLTPAALDRCRPLAEALSHFEDRP